MIVEYQVPFYANLPDNTHCTQACFRMVLKYFQPDRDYSWDELDRITAKVDGLWTWWMAGYLWLNENGYDAWDIGTFNYTRFVDEGGAYLIERYGLEAGQTRIDMSNIEQERVITQNYIEVRQGDNRPAELIDIENYLDSGHLVMCSVNGQKLINEPGFSGHSVLVIGYDEENLMLHNPGLPGQERQLVSKKHFASAWAISGPSSHELCAVQPQQ